MNSCDHLCTLLWRVFLLKRRRPVQTLIHLLLPFGLLTLIVGMRSGLPSTKQPNTSYKPFCLFPVENKCKNTNITMILLTKNLMYTPKTKEIDAMMEPTKKMFASVKGFDTIQNLEAYVSSINNSQSIAIQFEKDFNPQTTKKVNVKLRFPAIISSTPDLITWRTKEQKDPSTQPIYITPRDFKSEVGGKAPNYYEQGFLTLQQIILWLLLQDKASQVPKIEMQRFPFAEWNDDPMKIVFTQIVAFLVGLCYILPGISTLGNIVEDKESHIKDAISMKGVSRFTLWLSWFIALYLMYLIISVIVVIFLVLKPSESQPVIIYSDKLLVAALFIVYPFCLTTMIFLVSTLTNKVSIANLIGNVLMYGGLLLAFFLIKYLNAVTGSLIGVILPNILFAIAIFNLGYYEDNEGGVQPTNLWQVVPSATELSYGALLLIFIGYGLIYLIIALIFETIKISFDDIIYRFKKMVTKNKIQDSEAPGSASSVRENRRSTLRHQSRNFEPMPNNAKIGVEIRGLMKVYNGRKVVKGVWMEMIEGQITVLLGHNGAGKSTTISMLTGVIPPTEGTAIINGIDLKQHPEKVRKNIGLCAQTNVIIGNLTVREHIVFFSRLKGLNVYEAEQEARNYIKLLDFGSKTNARVKTLSGGMKRKMCVCIAMCGGSKVVILDEPTSGMDPATRRTLWDFLLTQKEGRTILLTTHSMDEADLLGDRTAIMTDGTVVCMGSNYFLKKRYGSGYHLIMDKSETCKPENVTALIKRYVPPAEMTSNIGSELSYDLPNSHVNRFVDMLQDLEANMKKLGVGSYGIGVTTMEEVFMKVGSEHYKAHSAQPSTKLNLESMDFEENKCTLICNQFKGAVVSHWAIWNSRAATFYLVPIVMILLVALSALTVDDISTSEDLPALELSIKKFQDVHIVVGPSDKSYKEIYTKVVKAQEAKEIIDTKNVTAFMLEKSEKERYAAKMKYIAGAELKESGIIAWFSGDPLHGIALSLGLVLNSVYKKILGEDRELNFINHPLKFEQKHKLTHPPGSHTAFIDMVANSMCVCTAFICVFYIVERVTMYKNQLMVSGMKPYVYWVTSYVLDILYLFMFVGFALIGIKLSLSSYDSFDDYMLVVVPSIFFIIAYLPFIYVISQFFTSEVLGPVVIIMIVMALSIVDSMLPTIDDKQIEYSIQDLLYSLPPYVYPRMLHISQNARNSKVVCANFRKTCEEATIGKDLCLLVVNSQKSCKKTSVGYYAFERPGIGLEMMVCGILLVIYFVLLFIIELKIYRLVTRCTQSDGSLASRYKSEDSDVEKEIERIRKTDIEDLKQSHNLILKDVSKVFGKFKAVRCICLGVKPNECFGLVGVNGAGKTTTFRMMTGEISTSTGEIYIKGLNVQSNLSASHKFTGYCPQFDALVESASVKTNLRIFCLMRGVKTKDIDNVIQHLGEAFGFTIHMKKKVKALSGGNKRKVSTAVACLGNPEIIYLDEPSAGMDPVARRHIWNIICALRDSGKCIILTSHNMEECEALCTRLAVMVNGEFKCLGSVQHLKSKHAAGCTLIIRVDRKAPIKEINRVDAFMKDKYPNIVLQESHTGLMSYLLPAKGLVWSEVFKVMEMAKKDYAIEDYTVGQNNLEQVFLTFTKYQDESK